MLDKATIQAHCLGEKQACGMEAGMARGTET
jgi:hypothetical protein